MAEARPVMVVAGIIMERDRLLICQRHRSDKYGMQWEFPGGKVRDGEDLKVALGRELTEELDIQAAIGDEVFRLRHRYPDRFVEVVFFRVTSYTGSVTNRVFESIAWAARTELPAYGFLEADRAFVARVARGEIV